jgi:hypothetical protein
VTNFVAALYVEYLEKLTLVPEFLLKWNNKIQSMKKNKENERESEKERGETEKNINTTFLLLNSFYYLQD